MKKYLFALLMLSAIVKAMECNEIDAPLDMCDKRVRTQIKKLLRSDQGYSVINFRYNNKEFEEELITLYNNTRDNYPKFMIQIDLNEFCNRWNLEHIDLDETNSDSE